MASAMFAQYGSAPLSRGEKQFNFGLGASSYGLPVYAGVDFAVHDDVTLGPVVSIRFDDDISLGLIVRGDYHFNRLIGIPEEWDFYAGASLGFFGGNDFYSDFNVQVGGRWYWSSRWGLNLEFGGGTGYGTAIGLSMKL